MTSIYKNKRSTELDELCKLLPKTCIQTIEDSLSTKLITQEEKKMKIKTEERRKLLTNNQKHFERKQDSLLRFKTFFYYRNECVRPHDKNNTFTKKRTNNIYVKKHESNEIKLRNL